MKQVKVSLPDDEVAVLEQAAQRAGDSLSGEIRKRLMKSVAEDNIRPDILCLKTEIAELIELVETQCGHRWSKHPATARALQLSIAALLARYAARADLELVPGQLPDFRLVAAGTADGVRSASRPCSTAGGRSRSPGDTACAARASESPGRTGRSSGISGPTGGGPDTARRQSCQTTPISPTATKSKD